MTAAEQRIFDRLKRDEDVRHARFKFDRCVYAYRNNDSDIISDNLLLLPKESEPAHVNYLRAKYGMVGSEVLSVFKDKSLVLIGHFNVKTLKFTPCKEKFVFSFNLLIDDLRKVEKK